MGFNINELAKIGNIALPTSNENTKSNHAVFEEIYKNAIDMIDDTNSLQKNAEQMSIDFAIGKIENIHDVMIAQEKASIALQYTVRVKNAVLDAYNEIMRMQL